MIHSPSCTPEAHYHTTHDPSDSAITQIEVNPGHPTIRIPAVIHLTEDGGVASVEAPGAGSHYARDIRAVFPAEVQALIFDGSIYETLLHQHLRWRIEHPDEPPLIVLDSTPGS